MAVMLTDKFVQGLHAEGKRREVRDAKVPGLVLRVTPAGAKTWSVQWRPKGDSGTQRLTLGKYSSKTGIAWARDRALEAIRTRAEGGDPIVVERQRRLDEERNGLTFSHLLDEYLERRIGIISMEEVARELRKDAEPEIGRKRPAEVTPADIDAIVHAILKRGAPSSARRMIIHIKALYNFALFEAPMLAQRYGITSNPAGMLGRRRRGAGNVLATPRARQRVLDDDEIALWWRMLDTSGLLPAKRLALKLVLVTAQRPGEVRKCQKHGGLQLDSASPTWTLMEHETKSRRRHVVPLSPLAVELWREAIALSGKSAYVFGDPERPSEPISAVGLPNAQANLFRIHLPDHEAATVHDLRRSAATGMRRLGVAPHVVSQILNHTRSDVTGKHYDFHEGLPERRVALERWAGRLCQIIARREKVVSLPRSA